MNKIYFKLFFIILLANHFCPLCADYQSSVEFRSAAFFHSSERFREIYGNVSASYEVEASANLCDCIDGWVNFDWFSKHGKSKGFKDPTRVNIANTSLGIKYPFCLCEQLMGYVGIGPSISNIWLKNHSHCCRDKTSKVVVGGVLKTGVYYFLNSCIFLDAFVDYLYQPVHFDTHVDIGGLKTGIGIGIRF